MKSQENSKKKNDWKAIGELRKTKSRKDMLYGQLTIPELNVDLKIFAFIKSPDQKKYPNEADIRILIPPIEDKEEENPFIEEIKD